jgi:putative phosphoribosyl transferase
LFRDRRDAGKKLARALAFLRGEPDVAVLAIPRGGVVIGAEVADALGASLGLVVTRKIGAPGIPELAVGAVTQDGEVVIDHELVRALAVPEAYLREQARIEHAEIARRMAAYGVRAPYPRLEAKTVVIVDDGVATGSTMLAAIASVRAAHASRVIVAAPVAAPESVSKLSALADMVVCLETPVDFRSIGQFYRDFDQVGDATVSEILASNAGHG